MKKLNFFVFALIGAIFASCTDELSYLDGKSEDERIPSYFTPSSEKDDSADIIFDDNSIEAVFHKFNLSAEAIRHLQGSEAVICTGRDTVAAENRVIFTYNLCENAVKVDGLTMEYRYNGKTYNLHLAPNVSLKLVCRLKIEQEEANPAFHAESVAEYTLYYGTRVLASTKTRFIVDEDYVAPEIDSVDWSYSHLNFVRNASISNNVISVRCNNVAKFADIYSDGSRQNEEEVNYSVVNKFSFNAPAMEVNLSDVIGRTFSFDNGTATVAGYAVKAIWNSANVEGSVMHNNTNYASQIVACRAAAKTITFNNASSATIRFYDNEADDYAEVNVPVDLNANVTLTEIERTFNHVAFRSNVAVLGNSLAITCDNEAKFVKRWSDGSADAAVVVNYPVVNNFMVNIPALVVENLSDIQNQSYSFNNGTAVIAGKNVNVNFVSRVKGDIIFENINYKNEAPNCALVATTITITSATTATITFEGDGETVSAVVPVSIIEAETINGTIKGIWATDSYFDFNRKRVDLHVLVETSLGIYADYSRVDASDPWTITYMTNAEAQLVLSTGRALAWLWSTNDTKVLGSVQAIPDNTCGYILKYFTLNGVLGLGLGDAEVTLSQEDTFRNPVRGVGVQVCPGLWNIQFNGEEYFKDNQY